MDTRGPRLDPTLVDDLSHDDWSHGERAGGDAADVRRALQALQASGEVLRDAPRSDAQTYVAPRRVVNAPRPHITETKIEIDPRALAERARRMGAPAAAGPHQTEIMQLGAPPLPVAAEPHMARPAADRGHAEPRALRKPSPPSPRVAAIRFWLIVATTTAVVLTLVYVLLLSGS